MHKVPQLLRTCTHVPEPTVDRRSTLCGEAGGDWPLANCTPEQGSCHALHRSSVCCMPGAQGGPGVGASGVKPRTSPADFPRRQDEQFLWKNRQGQGLTTQGPKQLSSPVGPVPLLTAESSGRGALVSPGSSGDQSKVWQGCPHWCAGVGRAVQGSDLWKASCLLPSRAHLPTPTPARSLNIYGAFVSCLKTSVALQTLLSTSSFLKTRALLTLRTLFSCPSSRGFQGVSFLPVTFTACFLEGVMGLT